MGPSPLSAVKSGRVDQAHDTKFVFAEVNSQTLYWKVSKDGKEELIRSLTDRVGKCSLFLLIQHFYLEQIVFSIVSLELGWGFFSRKIKRLIKDHRLNLQ